MGIKVQTHKIFMKFKKNSLKIRKQRLDLVLKTLILLFPKVKASLDYNNEWQFLIAVLMSAQTTDKQVNKVTKNLFKKYKEAKDFLHLTQQDLEKEINNIGLYKSKAKHILATAKLICEKFDHKVPDNMNDLILLPGVGRKTANVVLAEIFNDPVGIAVDTHVSRLAQKFGLVTETSPVKIEKQLMEILDKKHWSTFTMRMIEYGRQYSPAHKNDNFDDVISVELLKLSAID